MDSSRITLIVFFAPPVDPRVITAYDKQTDAFRRAIALFDAPVETIQIPFEQQQIYVRPDWENVVNIQCPTFLSEAEDDPRRGSGPVLFQQLTCPKEYVLFRSADGAGDHCEAGAGLLFARTLFNWLDPIMKP